MAVGPYCCASSLQGEFEVPADLLDCTDPSRTWELIGIHHDNSIRLIDPRILGTVAERITRDEVLHVACLARLELADDEIDRFTRQLGAILEHAADVEALDVADVEPTAHPLPLSNVMRADVVSESLERDEVMAAAPAVQDGQFRVPPVLGGRP